MTLLKFVDFVCAAVNLLRKGVQSFYSFSKLTIINLIDSPYFQGKKV